MTIFSKFNGSRRAAQRFRLPLLVAGLTLFGVGLVWALSSIQLDSERLRYAMLGPILLAVVLAVLVNALEQWLAARALAVEYTYVRALSVSSAATIANVLPLPGGLLVRAASFTGAGAHAAESAVILGAGAAIWVMLSAGLVILAAVSGVEGTLLAWALALGAGAVSLWLAWRFDPVNALGLLVVRIVLIALTVLRLIAILAFLAQPFAWREAAVYSGASLVGQVVGVVPAGVGLVESVGAALALTIGAAPEAAFVALSLNRIFGLTMAVLVVLAGLARGRPDGQGGEA